MLLEQLLGGEQAWTDTDRLTRLFKELSNEGRGCGLAWFHVAARQVVVASLDASAEQQPIALDEDSPGEDLDVVGLLGHGKVAVQENAMSKEAQNTRRLGRGLSGLLTSPVAVSVDATLTDSTIPVETSIDELKVRLIGVGEVAPNRFQPRREMDEAQLMSLSESIKVSGLIQPIAVRPLGGVTSEGKKYELIAGERRWRAARLAGLKRIPAVVTELDDKGAAEWAVIENVQREDLNPIDRAWAFRNLMEHFGLSPAEVGQRVGMERSTVTNFVRLTELENPIQRLLSTGKLSAGHGKALLTAPAGDERVVIATLVVQDGWSVRQTEAWAAKQAAAAAGKDKKPKIQSHAEVSAERAELERQLSEYLGTRVQVQTSANERKGRIVVDYYDLEHFDGVMQKIGFRMRS